MGLKVLAVPDTNNFNARAQINIAVLNVGTSYLVSFGFILSLGSYLYIFG